ncbi:amino acid permease, partial [Burkholderia pseudomallei]
MTQQQRTFDSIVEREKGQRRGLSSAQMAMFAIGGAIGTGLFLGSGFAIVLAGP